jgi:hypothetical protein
VCSMENEENDEESLSRWPVFRPRLEPGTARLEVLHVTATETVSVLYAVQQLGIFSHCITIIIVNLKY